MSNIASVLKEEISRIARKEIRRETASLKKSSTMYRSEIAALKRRVHELERQLRRAAGEGSRPPQLRRTKTPSRQAPASARRAWPRTAPPWFVGRRMRPSHRRIRAVGLQLGGGQGASARPAPTGDLCAQEAGAPTSQRDPGEPQGRLGWRLRRQDCFDGFARVTPRRGPRNCERLLPASPFSHADRCYRPQADERTAQASARKQTS